ncbi:MAG: MMPL family transporter [Arenicellales bacterium]
MPRPGNVFAVALAGVRLGTRRPGWTIVIILAICAMSAVYAARTLSIDTDTNALFASDIPYLLNEDRFDRLFPDQTDQILIVIDAATLAKAENGADELVAALSRRRDLFPAIQQPSGGPFFRRNGLLYLSTSELEQLSNTLSTAQPLLGALSAKPGLTGVMEVVNLIFKGASSGEDVGTVKPFLDQISSALKRGLSGEKANIEWASLFAGQPGLDSAPRSLVLVRPTLDTKELMPGEAATHFIRSAASRLGLTPGNGYRLRLTGSVVLSDEEFATVRQGAELAGVVAVTLVVILLILALRSLTLILAALVTLAMGLIATLGWAALAVGELNLISIAFTVMFIGIGIDFGIQFCMRLREERYRLGAPRPAIDATARALSHPLLVAAIATCVGFFSFLPTQYRGVAELGIIAGGGIIIALVLTLTLLPAILSIATPHAESAPVGYHRLAPFNDGLIRHRRVVLIVIGAATLVALAGVARLRFDFDPLHLKNPNSEGMRTLTDLMKDPWNTPYTLSAVADSPQAARTEADRLSALPQVRATVTALDLVPEHQARKLSILQNLAFLLGPALSCGEGAATPTAADVREAMKDAGGSISTYLASPRAASPLKETALALRDELTRLEAGGDSRLTSRISSEITGGFTDECKLLVQGLDARQVGIGDLPKDLRRSWIAPGGRYRIEIYPKFASPTRQELVAFVDAVRAEAPDASGAPISIYESSRLIINAFTTAAGFALFSITVLLALAMRRTGDVLRVLVPLGLSIVWTLGMLGLIGLPLNFANIIGLPLLLGVGVTFPIYLVHAWRAGEARLLAAPVARAVLFSALTTLASFGSLAISTHPGTSSLGVLLTVALGLTLLSTFVFLPALLGEPPSSATTSRSRASSSAD